MQIDFLRALISKNIIPLLTCTSVCPKNPSTYQILTYNSCAPDILINYSLIAVFQIAVSVQGIPLLIVLSSTIYL